MATPAWSYFPAVYSHHMFPVWYLAQRLYSFILARSRQTFSCLLLISLTTEATDVTINVLLRVVRLNEARICLTSKTLQVVRSSHPFHGMIVVAFVRSAVQSDTDIMPCEAYWLYGSSKSGKKMVVASVVIFFIRVAYQTSCGDNSEA